MSQHEKDVPQVLNIAAQHMRKVASDNVALLETNAKLAHELRLHKIAMRMEERRIEPEVPLQEKIANLHQVPPHKLDALEQAIELSVGGFKLGSLDNPSLNESGESSSVHHDLDSFIRSNVAYG